jgi:hypothetical protein
MAEGIVPTSTLFERSRRARAGRKKMSSTIVPDSRLSDSASFLRDDRSVIFVGMRPVRERWLRSARG